MARPRFRNELQLFAALDRLQIDKDSPRGLAFATGWQHRERDDPMIAPGWYAGEQKDMYDLGWKTCWRDVVAADSSRDQATLPPYARFELVKEIIGGMSSGLYAHDVVKKKEIYAAWAVLLADAVLSAMDKKQERSEAA